jgi:hypothetical protein
LNISDDVKLFLFGALPLRYAVWMGVSLWDRKTHVRLKWQAWLKLREWRETATVCIATAVSLAQFLAMVALWVLSYWWPIYAGRGLAGKSAAV